MAAPQAEGAAGGTCGCQKLLWMRRTHSACGLVFGAFLVEHLAAASLGLKPAVFGQYVHGVRALLRYVPWLEALVFLPLIVLVPFGVYLLTKAGLRYHVKKCKRGGKLRFFLQRVSALAILAFIAFHLLAVWGWRLPSAGGEATPGAVSTTTADPANAAFETGVRLIWGFSPSVAAVSPTRFVLTVLYLLGTAAVIYHLANGLWSGALAWGLAQSPSSQQRLLWACSALAVMIGVLGALGGYAFLVAPWSRAAG
jgi:succinate dehydrogenase / fumarate reductase cytochrome b subunit